MKTRIVSLTVCSKCESEVTELWEGTDICTDCSPAIFAQFEHVNADKGYRFGDDSVIETRFQTKGELYKHCVREYGRCLSKIYIDFKDGNVKSVGWVFLKREKYTDCDETYLQETWVTVHTSMPKKSIEYFYA